MPIIQNCQMKCNDDDKDSISCKVTVSTPDATNIPQNGLKFYLDTKNKIPPAVWNGDVNTWGDLEKY